MNKYLNIIFIIILLLAVFLARQPFAQKIWPNLYENVIKPIYQKVIGWLKIYIPKIIDFIQRHIISKIIKEAEKRKEIVEEEIQREPKEVSKSLSQFFENILKNLKNFFFNQLKKLFE